MNYQELEKLFPFKHRYITVGQNRIHYIDEGAGNVLLMFHACPMWSFAYRRQIQEFAADHRVIAFDMLGFGSVENGQELASLHIKQAGRENLRLLREEAEVSEVDDHVIHIKEHTKDMLANGLAHSERFVGHVRAHRLLSGAE